jgi:hypothetical protein
MPKSMSEKIHAKEHEREKEREPIFSKPKQKSERHDKGVQKH